MENIDLKRIAELARLHFEEEELKLYESQVAGILQFIEQLNEVDTAGVEPTTHPLLLQNVFRADAEKPSLPVDVFLKNSPAPKDRFFSVPKVIEDRS